MKTNIKVLKFNKQNVYAVYLGATNKDTSFVLKNIELLKFCSGSKKEIITLCGENVFLKEHWISGKKSIIPIDKIIYLVDLGNEIEYRKKYAKH